MQWNMIATLLPVSKRNIKENLDLLEYSVSVIKHGSRTRLKAFNCSQGRTEQDCRYRFTCVLDPTLIKGTWTKEEDEKVSMVLRSVL